ncbi:toll/interleukin-1 receptor domain-containing protein [Methylobacterium durans]|uniref:toll/interleukin-1 receptor domain-containing protein n=1 Tax=Methylobacterium durans TaxID=2202825 RepID=UPI002AFEC113|nr:toll/interleukin-1 receptor domain-containing protein [Methylobacterium durans]MEA1831727.1 toll/interleukin-1 receptor domain-containing protein [Methylobacterium durans]
MADSPQLWDWVLDHYRKLVQARHPSKEAFWPLLSGFNVKIGGAGDWVVLIYSATGMPGFVNQSGLGDLPSSLLGVTTVSENNLDQVRPHLERHYGAGPRDAVIFFNQKTGQLPTRELEVTLRRHEYAMGLTPMKIFLSHKGTDKPLVRDFEKTLRLLGFDPWLDEDAMSAGVELERALVKGFEDSCAVVFFVTKNYVDENFLASEVNYAIAQKRKKGDKFSIITLAFDGAGSDNISTLLHQYVWKTPATHLEALREIIKALPVKVGDVYWK